VSNATLSLTTKTSHLLFNELQTAVYCHHGLRFILLQQDGPDELVDIGIIVEGGEFLVDRSDPVLAIECRIMGVHLLYASVFL
jgi:hypothetical protein